MIILNNIFNFIKTNFYKILWFIVFFVILFIISRKLNKLINKKRLYVGCLYSKNGVIGEPSYNNYQILLESFKFSIKKYNINIDIVPIYTDLGDNLENFSMWIEDCVNKYNIKFFFGCWQSSERKKVIPILLKYNVRLFYPLENEGFEYCKNIYYFGACPNQYLIPSLKYMFDTNNLYKNVYIIGNDSSSSYIKLKLISKFITNKDNKLKYNTNLTFFKLYSMNTNDYSDFIITMFKKNPNGAILINLLDGKSYFDFIKQIYLLYAKYFPNFEENILSDNNQLIQYLDKNINNEHIELIHRYPSISFSANNNVLYKENIKYLKFYKTIACYSDHILEDVVYQIYNDHEIKLDFDFLKKYIKNTNKPIGDAQYCTFLSTQFFVKTLVQIINNGGDINDTNVYDRYMKQTVISVAGCHNMFPNNHISRHFMINYLDENGKYKIHYQSFKDIDPDPFMGQFESFFSASDQNLYYSSRLHM